MEVTTRDTIFPLTLTNENGSTINIIVRKPDGYVDATELCREMGKEWKVYYKTKNNREYLSELAKLEHVVVEELAVPFSTASTARNEAGNSGKCLIELGKNRHAHTWVRYTR